MDQGSEFGGFLAKPIVPGCAYCKNTISSNLIRSPLKDKVLKERWVKNMMHLHSENAG